MLSLVPLAAGSGRLGLLVAATSHAAFDALVELSQPTIPPMVRAPLTNIVPDFLVAGPALRHRGLGGVLAAGFYDHAWRVSRTSFGAC